MIGHGQKQANSQVDLPSGQVLITQIALTVCIRRPHLVNIDPQQDLDDKESFEAFHLFYCILYVNIPFFHHEAQVNLPRGSQEVTSPRPNQTSRWLHCVALEAPWMVSSRPWGASYTRCSFT